MNFNQLILDTLYATGSKAYEAGAYNTAIAATVTAATISATYMLYSRLTPRSIDYVDDRNSNAQPRAYFDDREGDAQPERESLCSKSTVRRMLWCCSRKNVKQDNHKVKQAYILKESLKTKIKEEQKRREEQERRSEEQRVHNELQHLLNTERTAFLAGKPVIESAINTVADFLMYKTLGSNLEERFGYEPLSNATSDLKNYLFKFAKGLYDIKGVEVDANEMEIHLIESVLASSDDLAKHYLHMLEDDVNFKHTDNTAMYLKGELDDYTKPALKRRYAYA